MRKYLFFVDLCWFFIWWMICIGCLYFQTWSFYMKPNLKTLYLVSFQHYVDTSDDTLIYFFHMDYRLNDVCIVDSYTSLQEHDCNWLDLYNDNDCKKPSHTIGKQTNEVQASCIDFSNPIHSNFQYRPYKYLMSVLSKNEHVPFPSSGSFLLIVMGITEQEQFKTLFHYYIFWIWIVAYINIMDWIVYRGWILFLVYVHILSFILFIFI